jgi:aminoglycoside 3-N-acetyltransferase I
MEIRVLGPEDSGLLRQLNAMFGHAFDDLDSYTASPLSDSYLAALLQNPDIVALVALHEGTVVGGIAGYLLPKFEQARKELYLYDLAVDAAYRRQGIATRLIERLQSVAVERGAWVIFVQADREDEATIALYSRFGLVEEVLHFDIPPLRASDQG